MFPSRAPTNDDRIRRALRAAPFSPGQEAVLIYRKRSRTANVPVTIVGLEVSVGQRDDVITDVLVLAYVVKSEFGGELTVRAEDLRPGTALDRITLALGG